MEKIKHKSRQWKKPELTVLVRRKPEEGILQNCKGYDQTGADNYFDGCWVVSTCWACFSSTES